MELLMEFVEGFGLIEAVVTAFLAFLGFIVGKLKPFIQETLKSFKKESDSVALSWIAEQAIDLIDERFKGENGHAKFEKAVAWMSERAKEDEIPVSEQKIRGAIQNGYNISKGKKEETKSLYDDDNEI